MRPPVRATYRVQLTPEFGFDDAVALVPYLHDLGISHLYTSPVAQATLGSTHGYDVTDHQRVRDELGGETGLRRLWAALDAHRMGMVVDIVPNHMGIRSPTNEWWQDVLRNGPASPYAAYFDIEWDPPDPDSEGRVVLPFLDRPLKAAVHDGVVRVTTIDGAPFAVHHDDRWPLSAASVGAISARELEALNAKPKKVVALLDQQHWRAVEWRRASELLNWRRFFDVTDLAAVRIERSQVFDAVHALLRSWLVDDDLGARVVQGVRVDHIDGLVDPARYLERLRSLVGPGRLIVVEKILAAEERLPDGWPVDGTTGYDLVARVNEAITDPSGASVLRLRAEEFTGVSSDWPALERGCRRLVAERILAPEVDRLTRAFMAAVAEVDGAPPDATEALEVVRALAAEMRVYRTYTRPGSDDISDEDRREIELAVARLVTHRPELASRLLATARSILVRQRGVGMVVDTFVTRFGQVTAPLAAKAVEDTAFYRAVWLPWLAEVGGDPERAGVATGHVHRALAGVVERWGGTLAPITTHDSKRGGDVRARLSRLAAIPDEIADAIEDWSAAAAPYRSTAGPDAALEWLLWLTMVGAWPIDLERMSTYATKAMREAKAHTSWVDPDPTYEDAVHEFLAGVFADAALLAAVDRMVDRVLVGGRTTSLVQLTLAATAAGSPDVYQGDDVWNLVLVDPDNRRPVDAGHRAALLASLDASPDLVGRWRADRRDGDDAGLVKLGLWRCLLALRAETPDAFTGAYVPLLLDGADAEAHLAFTRGDDVAIVVPLRERAEPIAAAVELPDGAWRDVVTGAVHSGGRVPVAELLDRFPVAVLSRR
jgi:(1->4)-alpha-D-glucan 1-alpha-D-glucosylmutase